MSTRKTEHKKLTRAQVMSIVKPYMITPAEAKMYKALGVLRESIHLLPEEARDAMRQVLRAVKQNQAEKRLDVVQRISILRQKRKEVGR